MAAILSRPQFSDEIIKATELNRSSGSVLDKAARQPITIIRNNEHFALLRREKLSGIVTEATQTREVLEILHAAFLALSTQDLSSESPYGWLMAFDVDEIQELVAEVLGAFRNAPIVADGWEELDAVIHEWHESAIAILSDDLATAFTDETEEIPLSKPPR
jgi:hypothetical protein